MDYVAAKAVTWRPCRRDVEWRVRWHSRETAAGAAENEKSMKSAQLVYSILCDDVRLELGNKLSLMGIFENVFLPSFPAMVLNFAVVNHWVGVGRLSRPRCA